MRAEEERRAWKMPRHSAPGSFHRLAYSTLDVSADRQEDRLDAVVEVERFVSRNRKDRP